MTICNSVTVSLRIERGQHDDKRRWLRETKWVMKGQKFRKEENQFSDSKIESNHLFRMSRLCLTCLLHCVCVPNYSPARRSYRGSRQPSKKSFGQTLAPFIALASVPVIVDFIEAMALAFSSIVSSAIGVSSLGEHMLFVEVPNQPASGSNKIVSQTNTTGGRIHTHAHELQSL